MHLSMFLQKQRNNATASQRPETGTTVRMVVMCIIAAAAARAALRNCCGSAYLSRIPGTRFRDQHPIHARVGASLRRHRY